ncbi:MATE family efflux transporter [Corynebacterium liangguodongii]|uniref:MATE family efflux transporter n=1 Tax=Corynebacterium liangguodongii TaxID=2079535 RepID=A0A2S0WEN1_9CORY|nr:MATE family efflux transporter [Corynebacterium liangguodongii]AWB84221.1 MATE family efflux transporter [Corynebacterium liangguodongii]PWC00231.1 MATE family efflux transporter [Corynebacterium liangguodongii]
MSGAAQAEAPLTPRRVLGLALPALGVLAASPLYLLLDTAVVGRTGTADLAALAAGTAVHSTVTVQLTFLSYGTTARSARLNGAGRRRDAVAEGVQATWVAAAVGIALATLVWLFAHPIAAALTAQEATALKAAAWMRVAAAAIPLTLVTMAGNGWMRGVQNTRAPFVFTLCGVIPGAAVLPLFVGRFGLVGSAWANVLGSSVTAALFVGALARAHRGSWAPRWAIIRSQLAMGGDLIVRSASFQVSMLAAATVAGRFGVASLAAHQILLQLWNLLTLVLDSLAIAAQTLTGAALGRGDRDQARGVGELATRYCLAFAGVLAVVFAAFGPAVWMMFTQDPGVIAQLRAPWWMLVAMIVVGGVVFALDGALLGAGDVKFLRTLTIVALLGVYLPVTLASLAFGWGLGGVWAGLAGSLVVRLVGNVHRFRSMKWAECGQRL